MIHWYELNCSDWRQYEKRGDRWLPWKQYLRKFAQTEFEVPDNLAGRGIIIPAGGKYMPGTWLTVRLLREYGCELPIEIWHLGPHEIPQFYRDLLRPHNVTFIDATEIARGHPARKLGGWQLKSYAIIMSRFAEVLLIDGDNHPTRDVTSLFDEPEYKETGAVFWPDRVIHGADSILWNIFDVPYREEWAHETGQILLDKRKTWHMLQMAMHMNEYSDFYYQHSHGDTATFRFAMHMLSQKFTLMPHRMVAVPLEREVESLDTLKAETAQRFRIANRDAAKEYIDMPVWEDIRAVFLQMDFAGNVLFEHRSGGGGGQVAFQPGAVNFFVKQSPIAKRCHALMEELHDEMTAKLSFWERMETQYGDRVSNKRREDMCALFAVMGKRATRNLVETGTLRWPGNWEGDGGMTWFLAAWARVHGGHLTTVDIDPEALKSAREVLDGLHTVTDFVESDSVEYLKNHGGPIDLLFLDSLDYVDAEPEKAPEHAQAEVEAALPALGDRALVAIDDCALPEGGKGALAVRYLLAAGWKLLHDGYITILGRGDGDEHKSEHD